MHPKMIKDITDSDHSLFLAVACQLQFTFYIVWKQGSFLLPSQTTHKNYHTLNWNYEYVKRSNSKTNLELSLF